MSDFPLLAELQTLLDDLREAELSEAGELRLAEILSVSAEARAYYLDHMRLVAILHRFHVEPATEENAPGNVDFESFAAALAAQEHADRHETDLGPSTPALTPAASAGSASKKRLFLGSRVFRWIAAAVIVLTAGLAVVLVRRRAYEPVAVLAAAVDARWEPIELPTGTRLLRGNLRLVSGGARIVFNDGADVIIYGPAQFELVSPRSLRLIEGRIGAKLEHGASGFTVETPSATLTDLGTEFGVSVDSAGATETLVLQGQVRVKPANAGATVLHADMAVTIPRDGLKASPIPFQPARFAHTLLRLDLADIVAGGDGTQAHRGSGIDAATGKLFTQPPRQFYFRDGASFHRVPGRPMIAGVFIPSGKQTVLDPAGHTHDFVTGDSVCAHLLWAGPLTFPYGPADRPAFPNLIGSIDYGILPHGLLFMHANKAVTFDLDAIAAAHPGLKIAQFHAICQNTAIQYNHPNFSDKADVFLFADGKMIDHHSLSRRKDPPIELLATIPDGTRYLTIAVTDGGDGFVGDWVTLGDPELR